MQENILGLMKLRLQHSLIIRIYVYTISVSFHFECSQLLDVNWPDETTLYSACLIFHDIALNDIRNTTMKRHSEISFLFLKALFFLFLISCLHFHLLLIRRSEFA